MTVTIPELQALARTTLDFGIEHIRQNGVLAQMFHLFKRDGTTEIQLLAGEITNSKQAKRLFGDLLRERCRQGEIEAVLMLSDIYFTSTITPEQEKIRAAFGWNIEEASAAGLCDKHEAVMVSLESPIYVQLLRQEYKRDGKLITLVGEPMMEDDSAGRAQFSGNFAGFFERTRQGKA